jgi:2-polyprenyl-3-methyl-5-hydroxy-6-metoxy-1,4-benzoquinol methylase
MDSQIYRDGRHFDRLYPATDPVHPVWLNQARQAAGPVLELACGTGRLCVTLAQAGYAIVGLDGAEPMLVEARRKAAAAGVAIDWVRPGPARRQLALPPARSHSL